MRRNEAVIGADHPDRDALLDHEWDVIVVGTGIGGGTFGHAMAKAGRSVLFVEKGLSHMAYDNRVVTDDWAEMVYQRTGATIPIADHLRRSGRTVDSFLDLGTEQPEPFTPMLGNGSGGSSALYGMVLERLFPEDFTPARYFPDAPDDANLPDAWPIGYDELAPYYSAAETLYQVHATVDPLRPPGEDRGIAQPPPFSPGNAELMDRFRERGQHPYYLPMACKYVPGCRECIGFLCSRKCKGDSATMCLEPALEDHGAFLLPDCAIHRVEVEKGRARAVSGTASGRPVRLKGRIIALAAGAIHSPAILLRSGDGPRSGGIANRSGEVGRNLMRHYLDYYILYPQTPPDADALTKQVALNDLYIVDGTKYGTIQSNGRMAPISFLAKGLKDDIRSKSRLLARAFPLYRPLIEGALKRMFKDSLVLAAIMEDLPYRSNRVALTPDGVSITYHYALHPYERERIATFRARVADLLGPDRFRLLKVAERNRTLGHMCGTCRFGDDPATSVLDRDNRAHEADGLYVVDSSFLPSSGGTNPSLTIAANALRVAHGLAGAGAITALT